MNMIKKLLSISTICLLLLPLLPVTAAEIKQDFEDQVPGSLPRGWGKAWGKQEEDLFMVSSEKAFSGSRSMVVDRLSPESTKMWGLSRTFPDFKSGIIKLSFHFLVIGPGNRACFSFELRGAAANTDRLAALLFKDRKIIPRSYAKSVKRRDRSILGRYASGQWYRISLSFPATPADGDKLIAELTPLKPFGKTAVLKLPMKFPQRKYGILMLNTSPGKNGYKLFIDDFTVTNITH